MRVLLVNPPLKLMPGEFLSVVPPMGPAYIAAVLEKAGHEVKILDCLALSWRKKSRYLSPGTEFIKNYLLDFKPEIVGISNLLLVGEEEVIKFARLTKRLLPGAKIIVGGANASCRPNVFIKEKAVDFVAIGEGEMTMEELVQGKALAKIGGLIYKNQAGKPIFNPPRSLIADLDSLPPPALHLLPMEEYFYGHPAGLLYKKKRFAMVLSSRGCPFGCSFCTNATIWQRKWRGHSVARVMAEIKDLIKKYRIEEIQFMDSNMSVDKKRLISLCRELKKLHLPWIPYTGVSVLTLDRPLIRQLADSGCYALQLGIEHGDVRIQARVGKIVPLAKTKEIVAECHRVGIWTHGYFIVGLPGETLATAYRSLDYAIQADLDSVSFFTAMPLPGSRLYQQVFGNRPAKLGNLRVYFTRVRCSDLTVKQMNQVIKTSFKKFLFFKVRRELNPVNFFRRLSLIKSWDDITFYARFLARFLQIESI